MITKVTGNLNRVLAEEARLQIGGLEYQVLIPEFVRRKIQNQVGKELTLHTTEFLDGNPMQGRVVPRLIGFLNDSELEFFELFCSVNKVGVRKALAALSNPIQDIANAIHREDSKWLTTLPGIGNATADQIVTTLKKKVTRFAMITESTNGKGSKTGSKVDPQLLEDAYQALLTIGNSPADARTQLDKVLASGKDFKTVEEIILEIHQRQD